MSSFTIFPGPGFDTQLINGILDGLITRVISKQPVIRQRIGELLASTFDRTSVAKALRNKGATDLPAHLGLTDSQASKLADDMATVIRRSVVLTTNRIGSNAIITIAAIESDFQEFLALPNAKYVSLSEKGTSIEIPVMEWLLLDPNKDIGQAAFDIVFRGTRGAGFDSSITRVSRSGRAIMATLEKLGGGTGYVLPSIVSGGLGKNFLEFAFNQPGVAEKSAQIVIKQIQ